MVCGMTLPTGLRESDRLPEPIFTPATKAESGHDINISEDEAAKMIGRPLVDRVKQLTLEIFKRGCAHAESKGIIIADTKFEFGLVGDGNPATDVVLIDEVLTPDSSRLLAAGPVPAGRGRPQLRQAVRPRLPRRDPLEQAAAGAVAARRGGPAHARKIRRSVPPPLRSRAPVGAGAGPDGTARLGNARQGRALRRRPARVREAVHRPGAAADQGQPRRSPRICSASTATPSPARSPNTASKDPPRGWRSGLEAGNRNDSNLPPTSTPASVSSLIRRLLDTAPATNRISSRSG